MADGQPVVAFATIIIKLATPYFIRLILVRLGFQRKTLFLAYTSSTVIICTWTSIRITHSILNNGSFLYTLFFFSDVSRCEAYWNLLRTQIIRLERFEDILSIQEEGWWMTPDADLIPHVLTLGIVFVSEWRWSCRQLRIPVDFGLYFVIFNIKMFS